MEKNIQRQKKEKIIVDILEKSQKCLFKKTMEKAIYRSFLKDLKPFIIINTKNIPNEIIKALEKEYYLIDRGNKNLQK